MLLLHFQLKNLTSVTLASGVGPLSGCVVVVAATVNEDSVSEQVDQSKNSI